MTLYCFLQRFRNLCYSIFCEPFILRSFGKCGKQTSVSRGFSCTGINNVIVGNRCYFGENCIILSTRAKVIIGDDVLFGPRVTIISGNHRFDIIGQKIDEVTDAEKRAQDDQDVVFEGDNWIGANATILKGVTLGKGSIVGANAVVTRSFPAFCIIAGNPARIIKKRFSEEQVLQHETLLKKRKEQ